MKRPLHAELVAREIVGERESRPDRRASPGLGQRSAEVAALCPKPAVVGPLDRIEKRLTSQGAKAVLITMIDHPPVAARSLYHSRMPARPPWLVGRKRPDQRIVRAMLPRSMDRAGASRNDHVSRGRPGGAADRRDEIKP